MNYYLSRDYKFSHLNDAGSKARRDIEHTLDGMGFLPVGGKHTVSKNRILHFFRTLSIVMHIPACIRKGDTIVVQYPAKYYGTICRLAHACGGRVITLIHDLGCFRQKHNTVKEEIRRLNITDSLIGHNPVMCSWLLDNGFAGYTWKKDIVTLQVFDFLSESVCKTGHVWPMRRIVYAGQMSRRKNSFLYDLGRYAGNWSVNLYGKGFDKAEAANPEKFDTKGFMLPDQLIKSAEGDFGLVWDGDSVDCCSGNWGEYLAINTPHKISLYLRCGLPIIIWSKAAMAGFVKENNIGICIDSLREINDIYNTLTEEEYQRMFENVQHVSRLISEGWYARRAVSEIVNASCDRK